MGEAENSQLIPEDAYETDAPEGTLGAEEELWLADPETYKLAGGAQKILASAAEGNFTGELIDCEIESNTGVHETPGDVVSDLISRRRELLEHAERLERVLGTSGTHPIGDWREQEIIDKPHYHRLWEKLGWLIRRNNTFSMHVHYAVRSKEKAIYMFNRIRGYVPHLLALSVNSPLWQGEITDMQSSRVLIFSRSIHRAGLPEPFDSWDAYTNYVDYVYRSGSIHALEEIWWDVRPHPKLGTIEFRVCDAQVEPWRSEALIELSAAICELLSEEYESGDLQPILPNREIEENKWSAQRYGLSDTFVDHVTHESIETRQAIEALAEHLEEQTGRDLSGVGRILRNPTQADRQLEVYEETGSTLEVAKDLVERVRDSVEKK
ncbi:MAG TPA: YbdK family carboxylate-amine ligase [Rubrobacteraceae bacterium]|nr:YbdK family carboxylate-amine ligase [Rubrobacteraceae bacterium]